MQRARELTARYCEWKIELGRVLAEIEAGGDHHLHGFSNIRDFAEQELGVPRSDISMLLGVGRSFDMPAGPADEPREDAPAPEGADGLPLGEPDADDAPDSCRDESGAPPPPSPPPPTPPRARPSIGELVAAGVVSMENATQLGRLWSELPEPSDEERRRWTERAKVLSTGKFRYCVNKAIEEARQGEVTTFIGLHVNERALADFRRARDIASDRARRRLTEGQVLALIARRYVLEEDKRFVGEKQRRVGPTKLMPGSRYVPAEVKRQIAHRSEARCEVGNCSHSGFLQLMHIRTPHAMGSGREVDDLAAGCPTHHVSLDAGVIRFVGFDGAGLPRFRTATGRRIEPRPRGVPPRPECERRESKRPESERPASCRGADHRPATREPSARERTAVPPAARSERLVDGTPP